MTSPATDAQWNTVFLLSGLLVFLAIFAHELDRFYAWLQTKTAVWYRVNAVFALLWLLYTVDVGLLIRQLAVVNPLLSPCLTHARFLSRIAPRKTCAV